MILVVIRKHDAHGTHMLELLRKRGEDVIALDYAIYPQQLNISFFSENGRERLLFRFSDKSVVSSTEVKSVLNRRQAEPLAPDDIKDQRIADYIVRESRNFLDALPQMLHCFWLSNPEAVRIASRKPYQLMVARQLGFFTPPTVITNSPEELEQFLREVNSDVACKALWTPGITLESNGKETGIALYTRRLKPEEVLKAISNVKNCPMIFQVYVDKAFELRITVVGKKVFACAIHSQKSERTKEDWRRYDLENTPHEEYNLPGDIQQKCIQLVEHLGLAFGCIDMIITPSREYVFLEINPNGNWLWIEHLTGLPISETIAELLANPPQMT